MRAVFASRRIQERKAGFTLIEILAAVAIISVLLALVIPSLSGTLRAASLNTGGRILIDQINLARQTAQSRNLPVEVRLYKQLPDHNRPVTETVSSTSGVYRGFQLFLIDASGTYMPLAKPDYFNSPVVISTAAAESALVASKTETVPTTTDINLGDYKKNYRFVSFQFAPGGSTDLAAGNNFVTVVLQNGATLAQGANFFTVQIDPINGSVRSFRP